MIENRCTPECSFTGRLLSQGKSHADDEDNNHTSFDFDKCVRIMEKRIISSVFLLITFQMFILSQNQEESTRESQMTSKVYISYLLGGQFYNDHFLYNPGFSALFTQSYKLTNSLEAGIGSGYTSLLNESFIPFYVEAFGYKKNKQNSPVIRFQLGYAAAWYRNKDYPTDYVLNGGLYFNAGMGRKIQLRNRYSVLFHWSYCHQSGSISYQVFGNNDYSSSASYDMFQISFGIIRD